MSCCNFFPEVIVLSVPSNFKCCIILRLLHHSCVYTKWFKHIFHSNFCHPSYPLYSVTYAFTSFCIKLKDFLYHFPYFLSALFPLICIFFWQNSHLLYILHTFCLFCSSASKLLLSLSHFFLKYSHTLESWLIFYFSLVIYSCT